ncbi:MAG TPA: ABC transporter [Ruminococcaceae bacterium]|jgi:ABC-2 type transport system permease protein|nr:ABC transporter permease subunit [Oscillospiraceae bacterium]HCA71772.1 ABC transporter [Oscillospiraceae bacterium]HCC02447.1 ABC transporter [Oscillospiraceae bacterium]HCM23448.1 ABC transporter [Oscillospiraceae bacterium]
MGAVAKKELKQYFHSPVAYVCIGVLMALFGFFYTQVLISGSSSNISYVYSNMFVWCMLVIPILTMRTLSEERRNKTDQALLTAPVSTMGIAGGKFVGAFSIYGLAMTMSLIPAVVLSFVGKPNWGMIFGEYLGALFFGMAMTAIGIFVSSLTENPVIAAIGSLGIAIFLMVIDSVSSAVNNPVLSKVVSWISFSTRYQQFTSGTFDISSVVFFLSVTVAMLFLTSRRLESRRWN